MGDQTIFYILAFLGWLSLLIGKISDREGTILEWVKDNAVFILSFGIAVAGTALIGPGDNVPLGSYAARTLAFALAATIGEGMWRAFTAKKAAKNRGIRKASLK